MLGLFFSALCSQGFGQLYNPDKVNKKAAATYQMVFEALDNGDYNNAKELCYKSMQLQPDFVDAWATLASIYGEQKNYDSAIYFFDKAISYDPLYTQGLQVPYSINLAGLGRFKEAREQVLKIVNDSTKSSRYKESAMQRLKQYEFAIAFEAKHGKPSINPINLGNNINSAFSEYYPSFTIDDSLLVFTRLVGQRNKREDFYKSTKLPDGGFTAAVPIEGSLNEHHLKGGMSISQDGSTLVYAANYGQQGFGDFDIYMSFANKFGWGEPANPGPTINSPYWESSPSLSPDKQTLYFSSNRPGGYGGKDLYVSYRNADGTWGSAQNMGPDINTPFDDLAPFIHADNQTLYFTTGGHTGYGGSDVFVTKKGPGGIWGIPQNLGYPINTIENEGSLIVTADGKTAYYSANFSDSKGLLDLYKFDLPAYARPLKTLWVKGKVTDIETGEPITATIDLKNTNTKLVLEDVNTDGDGKFLVTLPVGSRYLLTINKKGYLFYSDAFDLSANNNDSAFVKNVRLKPIKKGVSLVLNNIQFESNSAVLDTASHDEINNVVALLENNPTLRLEIGGHTDNTGIAANNLKLSMQRAQSVVDYIAGKGIVKSRLTAKGYGASKPVADNQTEAGKAANRRTEIVVL